MTQNRANMPRMKNAGELLRSEPPTSPTNAPRKMTLIASSFGLYGPLKLSFHLVQRFRCQTVVRLFPVSQLRKQRVRPEVCEQPLWWESRQVVEFAKYCLLSFEI